MFVGNPETTTGDNARKLYASVRLEVEGSALEVAMIAAGALSQGAGPAAPIGGGGAL